MTFDRDTVIKSRTRVNHGVKSFKSVCSCTGRSRPNLDLNTGHLAGEAQLLATMWGSASDRQSAKDDKLNILSYFRDFS